VKNGTAYWLAHYIFSLKNELPIFCFVLNCENLGKLKWLRVELNNTSNSVDCFAISCKSALNIWLFWKTFVRIGKTLSKITVFIFSIRCGVVLLWTWICFFVKKSGDQLICVPAVLCLILLRLSTFRRYERELKFPLKDFHEFLMNFLDEMVFLSYRSSWKDMD